jgi:hypothetical protein
MPTRDELKVFIDQIPPEKLDLVYMNLESILHPHPPVLDPQIEQIMRRSAELQRELVERLPPAAGWMQTRDDTGVQRRRRHRQRARSAKPGRIYPIHGLRTSHTLPID